MSSSETASRSKLHPASPSMDSFVSCSRWKLTVSVALYGMVFNGAIYGYTSPALPTLQRSQIQLFSSKTALNHSDLTLSDSEASWFSSLPGLGYPLGTLTSGFVMDIIGRRFTAIFFHCFFFVTSYAFIFLAQDAYWLYVGRLTGGVCQGICNCFLYVFIVELCLTSRQKAVCGALLSVCGYSGTLITYILGIFLDWRQLSLAMLLLAVPYLVGMVMLVPESPYYYLAKGRTEEAMDTFTRLHKVSSRVVEDHLKDAKEMLAFSKRSTNPFMNFKSMNLMEWPTLKPVLTGIVLMLFYQFAGYNVICYYAASILKDKEIVKTTSDEADSFWSGLDPVLLATVVVALAGLAGVLLGVILVRKFARKTLMLVSSFGTSVAFIGLGIYFLITHTYSLLSPNLWLPTLSLVGHMVVFSLGYGSFCYPLLTELQSASARPASMALIATLGGLFTFANAKSFVDMNAAWGGAGAFLFYGGVNLAGALYIAVVVPDI